MMLLALSALLAPPGSAEHSMASLPSLFCGSSFAFQVAKGEVIWRQSSKGRAETGVEAAYQLKSSFGDATISEHREFQVPESKFHAIPLGPALGFSVYENDPRSYRLSALPGSEIQVIVVRFAETFPTDNIADVLRRFRRPPMSHLDCRVPDNRH